jgi:agmatine deiminase
MLMPAEWEPHGALWIGFPGDPVEWPVGLAEAQGEVAAFANAIAADGAGEAVWLICRTAGDAQRAASLVGPHVTIITEHFGDIWLRDSGPIVSRDAQHRRTAHRFAFNGWGGKFAMPGDQDIGERLARGADLLVVCHAPILEGGAIDVDGTGWLVTTRQCVRNPNRSPELSESDWLALWDATLGIKQVLWLGDGLTGDHTDGHVDNLARFVAPQTLAIPKASSDDDPNAAIFAHATTAAQAAGLSVVAMPSVGRYAADGAIIPASYMNFAIGNRAVVVPQYGAPNDQAALAVLADCFPDRAVVGLTSKALLRGGGSFHCISQQLPAAVS